MSCCPNNTHAIYFQAFVIIDGHSKKCLKCFNWFGKKNKYDRESHALLLGAHSLSLFHGLKAARKKIIWPLL